MLRATSVLLSAGMVFSLIGAGLTADAAPVVARSPLCVSVPGGVAGDVAVVNITNTDATGSGYGALRSSDARPVPSRAIVDQFSSVNFAPGEPNPNLAFVTIGSDGRVCYDSDGGTTNVILDLAATIPKAGINNIEPDRLIDTRTTGPALCGRGVGLTEAADGDGHALFAFDVDTGQGNYLLGDFMSAEGPVGEIVARIPATGNHVAIGPDCYVYFVTSRATRTATGGDPFDSGMYRVPLRSQTQLTQSQVDYLGPAGPGMIQSISSDRRFVYTSLGSFDIAGRSLEPYDFNTDPALYNYRFAEFDLAIRSLSDPDGSNQTIFIEDTATGARLFEGLGSAVRPRSDGTVWLGSASRLQQFDPTTRTLTTIPFVELTCFHTEDGEDLDFVPDSFDLASDSRVLKISLRDSPSQTIRVSAYSVSRFDTGNFCS